MNELKHAHAVGSRERVTFSCSACGACCRNVRDSIILEPFDAFRLVRHLKKEAPGQSAESLLSQVAELKPLSRGYYVYVLKTVNDTGVCTFLKDGRCAVYPVRPRPCRLYPFTLDPTSGTSLRWYLCTEQPHHFKAGHVTAREWQRRNLPEDDRAFLLEEIEILPRIGRLLQAVPEAHIREAETYALLFSYLSYDFEAPFLPQYRENMKLLIVRLRELAGKEDF